MSLQSLTASSTPEQIAAAYKDYSSVAGNNVAVQEAARTMLLNKGIAAPSINQAFSLFANPVALKAEVAPVITPVAAPIANQMATPIVAAPVVQKPVTPIVSAASTPLTLSQYLAQANQTSAATTSPASTAPAAGGVSDAFILSWLAKNPNPTNAQIAALSQFGVTADRVKSLSGAATAPVSAPVTAQTAVASTASNPYPGLTVEDLYRMHAGKEPDAEGLAFWKNAFGPEISEAERAQFIKSVVDVQNQSSATPPSATTPTSSATTPVTPAQSQPTTNSLAELYRSVLGREASDAELASWNFGNEVDAQELDSFLGAAREEVASGGGRTGATNTLAQQILSQGKSGNWTGEGFGSAEKNAYDMAAMLAAQGLTDINQFGVRTKIVPAGYSGSSMGGSDTGAGGEFIPEHEVQEYYNKATGQAINPYYDKGGAGVWGGTFAGEGSTSYGVQFKPDGTPVFYTQYGGSSNDFGNLMAELGPVAQIALAVATGGMSLPYALATQFAVQVLSGADPQDALKGAALSYGLSQVPGLDVVKEGTAYLNSIDPSGVLASSLTKAATSGISAAATGQDVSNAMLSGAVSGGVSGAINAALKQPEFGGMSAREKKLAANAMTGVLTGKPLDQVLLNTAISAAREATKGTATKDARTSAKVASETVTQGIDSGVENALAGAGLSEDDVSLPTGIQTASSDGETPFRVESSGTPIYADSPRADSVTPPPGYRLMATTEEQEVQNGDRTQYIKPTGAYYDYTANAWFVPSGEFDSVNNVEDYSNLFDGSNQNLTDADVAAILGNDFGSGEQTDFDYADFLNSIGITNTSDLGSSPSNQEILDSIGYVPPSDAGTVEVIGSGPGSISSTDDAGEMVITAPRIPVDDAGEIVITAPREPATDVGEIVVTAPRLPVDDAGEMVITAPRIPADDAGEIVVTAPRIPPEEAVTPPVTPPTPPVVTPPATVNPPAVTPPKVTPQQIAQILGVPVSSPVVRDMIEALYGTMEYLDIDAAFSPSATRAQDQAATNRMQQTKMAQGGYLDNLLAENMSVDDLLNLLR